MGSISNDEKYVCVGKFVSIPSGGYTIDWSNGPYRRYGVSPLVDVLQDLDSLEDMKQQVIVDDDARNSSGHREVAARDRVGS